VEGARQEPDRQARERSEQLRKLVPSHEWKAPAIDRDEAAHRLLSELSDSLKAAGVAMPATPDVSHEELLDRALDRRQPFDQNGSGYRDALLWQIVRHYVSLGHAVALVSNDAIAFAEGRNKGEPLATSLADELTGGGSACLYAQMSEAIQVLGLVQAEALDATRQTVERLGVDFADMLHEQLFKGLSHAGPTWITRDLVNPFLASSVRLGVAHEVSAVVREARRMGDGRLEASVVLQVRQWLTVWLSALVADHVESIGQVTQVDEDGNIGLEFDATVEHRCRVVLDPIADRIVSAEVLDAIGATP
jgi:hypothetical protein